MLVLLLAGGLVYLALGDVREAIILVVFATLSILITVIQETHTERVLEALRDLTSPEEFPVVLAVFMAMGAWRISRARVLTRRAAAIEALGSATVLCTDKTGTLTENRMSIAELRLGDGRGCRPMEPP